MRPLAGWRAALRIARRDARRSLGRTALVLIMIALPLVAVTIADVVRTTSDVTGTEALDRQLGTAAARVDTVPGDGRVEQGFDGALSFDDLGGAPTLAQILGTLGERGTATIPLDTGQIDYATKAGVAAAQVTETDASSPLADGLFDLTAGRWPRTSGEVTVSAALAARGPALGDQLSVTDGPRLTVVGIAESTDYHRAPPMAVGLPGSFGLPTTGSDAISHSWLVGGAAVTWEQVRRLNRIGALVVSRSVLTDPPPDSALPPSARHGASPVYDSARAVLVLIVAMVLLEVVLLAGPAFAVGARRQARTLALVTASGGTPKQARRVILAGGVVLGLTAAVIGVVAGLLGAAALMPVFQHYSDNRFGPFDVRWLHLLVIAAFGLVAALLAAVVPAVLASRQDVVAVLGGRRGDARPSRRSPVIGLVLLGIGVAGAVYGAQAPSTGPDTGSLSIAAAAVVCVLGMLFVVPVVVVAVAKLAARAPLPLRFAARDAARHRTRTVPAVAAVAATVAGTVALGISISSDSARDEQSYHQSLPMGSATVDVFGPTTSWADYRAALGRELPHSPILAIHGVNTELADGSYVSVTVHAAGSSGPLLSESVSVGNSDVLVADDALPPELVGVPRAERAPALAALHAGGAVAFSDHTRDTESARLVASTDGRQSSSRSTNVTVAFVPRAARYLGPSMVLSTPAARALSLTPRTVGLFVPGPITAEQQQNATEAVAAIAPDSSLYTERGYTGNEADVLVQVILGALAAVLMLGGTLTATFLALSDARPDLATLAAVGAAPRTRRRVAAAYALVVGLVGAVLGALVGAVPGIAIVYPQALNQGTAVLDIPWLLILGIVVGLPLVTAALVGATARSRLPMASRSG